jgi:hypothetical protein
MRVIGFTGPAGCGKTTAAKYLENKYGVPSIKSFAAPMKRCLMDLFKFTPEQLYTLEGKEALDPRYGVTPRLVMQRFGTEFVRSTVPNLWVILMEQSIINHPIGVILIDDCRFEDEATLIRKYGTLVHITDRCLVKHDHKSESGVQLMDGDIVVQNTGTLEDFYSELDKIA